MNDKAPDTTFRILHLEDDPVDSDLVYALLQGEGMIVTLDRVDALDRFKAALAQHAYALILADYTIPGVDPLEALRWVVQAYPDVPFVFLSGTLGEDHAIETLKLGAKDYVLKQQINRLVPAVRRALQEAEQQSRRQQAEETVRRLATIVESSHDAIISKTLEGIILSWNGGAERMYGYSAQEVIGQSIALIIPPDKAEDLPFMLAKIRQGESIANFETERVRKDGRLLCVSLSVSPILDAAGQILGSSVIARDITESNAMQRALQKLNAELEQRVAERTAQLRQLTAELTRAEEHARRNAAEILHEGLQQLLVGAKFNLHSLHGQIKDKVLQQRVQLVQDILSESMQVSNSLTHDLSPPILHQPDLASAVRWLSRWYEQKHGLTVRVETPTAIPVSSEAIRMALFRGTRELLLNVVKHAQVPTAQVSLNRTSADEVQIEVSDGGLGFDPARIRLYAGSEGGFGLLHLRERLEILGGYLKVESAPGQGSRCTLSVPGCPET